MHVAYTRMRCSNYSSLHSARCKKELSSMILERRGKNRLPDLITSWLARGLELEDFMHMIRYSLSAPFTSTMASTRNIHIFKAGPWAEDRQTPHLGPWLPALVAWSWKDIVYSKCNIITVFNSFVTHDAVGQGTFIKHNWLVVCGGKEVSS